jgi:nicotinate-nucleotide adenylyltransferase
MKVALFGGTFDPVHWGHLLLAESARTAFQLDRVIFVPTGQPPHKSIPIASAAHRLRMLRLAIASNPHFQLSDWEIRQKRVVYSHETVAHFRQQGMKRPVYFIVGADMLQILPDWNRADVLLKECIFLAADRPGFLWKKVPAAVRGKARRIDWPATAVASRDIRKAIGKGKSIRYLVPDAVERYIQKHRLYR